MDLLPINTLPPGFKALTPSPDEIMAHNPGLSDHVALQLSKVPVPKIKRGIWQHAPILDTGLYILRGVFSQCKTGNQPFQLKQVAWHLNYFFDDIIRDPANQTIVGIYGISDSMASNRTKAMTDAGVEFMDLSKYDQGVAAANAAKLKPKPTTQRQRLTAQATTIA